MSSRPSIWARPRTAAAFTCAEVYTVPGSEIRTACQMNAELAKTGDAPAK